ncbi:MAG: 23S rRNA (guanosine(2251)-2'-O)-methyltransferase RlmB [Clostridia bacterium]|nr:23S rRNA (guanosine(2251)-2'-O)-methyltransferase RlmB [Clostridia bacterium]
MNKYNSTKTENEPREDVVVGRNAVRELLRSGRAVDKIFVAKGSRGGSLGEIISDAKRRGIAVNEASVSKLDGLACGVPHQGVAAITGEIEYSSVDDILAYADSKGEPPFVVIADSINDPRNLGALARCADAAGAHGMIIPSRHSAGMTPVAVKASAGAAEHLKIAKVVNLSRTIEQLKKAGLWIFCAEAGAKQYSETDMTGPAAFIFGSEGSGVSRILREASDFQVSITMRGMVNSLNVSCAAAVILCEAANQRAVKSKP